jgi:hypothetical protein
MRQHVASVAIAMGAISGRHGLRVRVPPPARSIATPGWHHWPSVAEDAGDLRAIARANVDPMMAASSRLQEQEIPAAHEEQTMAQYMLSVHTATDAPGEPTTEQQQMEGYAKIAGLEAEMEAAKAFVFSARLSQPSEAKVVRRGAGRPKSTDGPFTETKEHLGGFYLIEAPDIDVAVEWASRVSDAIGEPIEVRPLAGSRGG